MSSSQKHQPHAELDQLVALFNGARYAELESRSRTLVGQHPKTGFAWKALGIALLVQGKDALQALERTVELLPKDAEAHCNLGNALQTRGRLGEAASSYRLALRIRPDLAEAHYNLGNIERDLGKLEDASACYRRAVRINPDYAEAHCNLGIARHALGQRDQAVAHYQRALQIRPDFAEAHYNLGVARSDARMIDAAMASYQRALEIKPAYAEAHYNLGIALRDAGRLDESVASYRRALAIKPDYAEALSNLGVALRDLGRLDDALACYRQALILRPDYSQSHDNLLFAMQFIPELPAQELLDEHLRFAERFEAPLISSRRPHKNNRDPGRRLKIGYVSPDFRRHAVANFIEPILANHDKNAIDVYCYYNREQRDEITERLAAYADHWLSCKALTDEQLEKRIRADGIDILVDLAGHTAGNRLLLFARKPSPVQVTYLGYPGTSGLAAMDYRVTDGCADPDGSDFLYSEILLRMPHSLCCYRPAADMPGVASLPALQNGRITFGSFNNANKIGEPCIDLWASLLRALPDSRLLMVTVPEGEGRARLAHMFAARGVGPERLEFEGMLPGGEFRRTFHRADIALDPVPVTGGTTTCESLWMGLPVVVLAGERFISRVGFSFLNAAGVPEFAAHSRQDYIETAKRLAEDIPRLAGIRDGLRAKLAASPLMDEGGFTRNLEKQYRAIWTRWCASEE